MGSSDNSAQRAAERKERAREAQIQANTGQVNAIYDSPARAQQIEEFTNAVRQQYMGELQRQQGINSRQLDFSLARSGQTGGSLDRDQNKELGESFQRGVLRSEQGAQNSAAQLRGDDEASRNQLLALVQSGGDVQSALSNAAASQRNNLLSAKSTVDVRSILGLFDQRACPIEHGSSPKQSPLPLASSASKRKPMKRAPCGSTPAKSWQAPSRGPSVATRSEPATTWGATAKCATLATTRRLFPSAAIASSTRLPGVPRGETSRCDSLQ